MVAPEARIYDHGPGHPLRPQRVLLTWDLIAEYGLDRAPGGVRLGLNFHIDSFNKNLSELGITVEPEDIIQECKATLQKFSQEEKLNYNWLIEWINEYKLNSINWL